MEGLCLQCSEEGGKSFIACFEVKPVAPCIVEWDAFVGRHIGLPGLCHIDWERGSKSLLLDDLGAHWLGYFLCYLWLIWCHLAVCCVNM